jgi:membrane-bound lytic murein transglycosylase B
MLKINKVLFIATVVLCLPWRAVADQPEPAQDFASFIAGVKSEAEGKGFNSQTLAVLDTLSPIDKVVELDRRQPEFTITFQAYLKSIMKPERVAKGRKLIRQNKELLDEIGKKYHVQPRFVVALWGIESGFGQSMGNYSILSSLATLAWEGRRAAFFRGELFNALTILDKGDVPAAQMRGSWAGAMGQCQFMPSTYLKYAQDWDGDGRRDIWQNRGDVLASTANYLSQIGWHDDRGWGRPVRLPKNFDRHLIGLDTKKTMKQWSSLGILAADGKKLPARSWDMSVVMATPDDGPAFLVTDNYRAIMTWNRSTLFALSVGHLADALGRR